MNRREFLVGVSSGLAGCALPFNFSFAAQAPNIFTGGEFVAVESSGFKNEFLHLYIILPRHNIETISELYFGDKKIPLDKNGNALGEFSDLVFAKTSTNYPIYAPLKLRLNNFPGAYVRLKWHPVKFSEGIPAISFGVIGEPK